MVKKKHNKVISIKGKKKTGQNITQTHTHKKNSFTLFHLALFTFSSFDFLPGDFYSSHNWRAPSNFSISFNGLLVIQLGLNDYGRPSSLFFWETGTFLTTWKLLLENIIGDNFWPDVHAKKAWGARMKRAAGSTAYRFVLINSLTKREKCNVC